MFRIGFFEINQVGFELIADEMVVGKRSERWDSFYCTGCSFAIGETLRHQIDLFETR